MSASQSLNTLLSFRKNTSSSSSPSVGLHVVSSSSLLSVVVEEDAIGWVVVGFIRSVFSRVVCSYEQGVVSILRKRSFSQQKTDGEFFSRVVLVCPFHINAPFPGNRRKWHTIYQLFLLFLGEMMSMTKS